MIPIAGSAYTYGYTTLGELMAWIIGWALCLEYAFGAATVAVGWSGYVSSLLGYFGIKMPFNPTPSLALNLFGHPFAAKVDIFALCAIIVVTTILVVGVKESANFNSAAVMIKVSVVLFFVGIATIFAFTHWSHMMANWHPFIPKNQGSFGAFGWSGIMRGGSVVFFAYIGFDAVSTAAQEARNPQKDLPFGILGSLIICTILYIIVSALLTGIKPYGTLNTASPVADGAAAIGATWGVVLIDLGAIAGLASVMLVMILGQTRVLYTMAHDGLLPKWVGSIHPRFRTPWLVTMATGVLVAFLAAFFNISFLGELVSLGTLLAFTIVCLGVIGDAEEAAGRNAALPHALGAVCAHHGHDHLPGADGLVGYTGEDRVLQLADRGAADLLRLLDTPQQGAERAGHCNAGTIDRRAAALRPDGSHSQPVRRRGCKASRRSGPRLLRRPGPTRFPPAHRPGCARRESPDRWSWRDPAKSCRKKERRGE